MFSCISGGVVAEIKMYANVVVHSQRALDSATYSHPKPKCLRTNGDNRVTERYSFSVDLFIFAYSLLLKTRSADQMSNRARELYG